MKVTHLTLIAFAGAALLVEAGTALAAPGINVGAAANASIGAGSTSAEVKLDAKTEAKMTRAKNQADKEIDRRIKALTELKARIGEMKFVSATDKAALQATLDAQISALSALKIKIDDGMDLEVLKTDIMSITASHRIYALILPQAQIIAAADRMVGVVGAMTTLSAKLALRISEAKTAGSDVTKAEASLATFNAKIASAQSKASAAVAAVAGLKPDNGDKTIAAANREALTKARAELKAGRADLTAARKEYGTMRGELGKFAAAVKASATTTAAASSDDDNDD